MVQNTNEIELVEGTLITRKLNDVNGSQYLLLSPAVLQYLGWEKDKEMVIKLEKHKRFGNYLGVGLKK